MRFKLSNKTYSVVMLTYNHELYISESINAIYNQDYKEPFEFIILNKEMWQPVGESNPSFQVENLAS